MDLAFVYVSIHHYYNECIGIRKGMSYLLCISGSHKNSSVFFQKKSLFWEVPSENPGGEKRTKVILGVYLYNLQLLVPAKVKKMTLVFRYFLHIYISDQLAQLR